MTRTLHKTLLALTAVVALALAMAMAEPLQTISGPARVIDGDTVVVAGTLDRDERHRLDIGHHPHGQ